MFLEILWVSDLEVITIDKVIDLAQYKKDIEQRFSDSELGELEEIVNILCQEYGT